MIPYLQFDSLEKRYGRVPALAGIDLHLCQGSTLALLGPNGAGKSTLFGCLLGLTRPTAGRILLRGRPITDAMRAGFGYTPERVALYPHESAWKNGLFFAQLRGQDGAQLERQLKRVGLDHIRDRKVRQLSKGMLQRLGLAIALCGEPELLVLDEPFNGLDPALLDGLRRILREEQARGATLLISTHTMSAIEPLASHVAILLDGKLAASGPIEELRALHDATGSLEALYHQIASHRRLALEEVAV